MGRIAQYPPQRFHAFLVYGGSFPISRSQRSAEMLRRVRAIESHDAKRQQRAQRTPVVWRPIGYCDDPSSGTLDQCPHHFCGPLTFACGFIRLRHTGHTTGVQTLAVTIIIGDGGTAHFLRARRTTG